MPQCHSAVPPLPVAGIGRHGTLLGRVQVRSDLSGPVGLVGATDRRSLQEVQVCSDSVGLLVLLLSKDRHSLSGGSMTGTLASDSLNLNI